VDNNGLLNTALDYLTAIYNMPDRAAELAEQALAEIQAADARVVVEHR
jgi:hypothetical protein